MKLLQHPAAAYLILVRRMNLVRGSSLIAILVLLLACDNVQRSARHIGLSGEDARDIVQRLRAEKHPHVIYQFQRTPNGKIIVVTDIADFRVEGSSGKWTFTESRLD